MMFAIKHYENPHGDGEKEFHDDLKRFKYIKRLINRYQETGKLSERLILNHLIVVFNVFGVEATLKILELKILEKQWHILKPFLLFLKYITESDYLSVSLDHEVVDALRRI